MYNKQTPTAVTKWFLPACFLLVSLSSWGQTKVHYRVFYDNALETNGLKVQLDFDLKRAGDSSALYYRNRMWDENNIFRSLLIHADENPGMRFKADTSNNRILLYHPKSKHIRFTYRIKQDYAEPDYNVAYRPRVHYDFFHVLGQTLFAVPMEWATTHFMGKKLDVQIEWVNFPEGFKIHNTFASQTALQKTKTTLWDGLYHSLFVGGDYRIYTFKHQDKLVHLAVRGEWLKGADDAFWLGHAQKAIQSQRDFWNDYSQDYFTLIISPTVSQNDSLHKGRSVLGTAVTNAFFVQATNNPFNEPETFIYVLHHELMHYWIGGKIKTRHEELNYWFSEGFTDYYTYKNRLRCGNLTFTEWQAMFNKEVIQAHWKNPERNIPNYRIKDAFWESRNVEKVPYRRGAIFAFWLDNQILLKSNYTQSLDNLMRDLLAVCTKEGKLMDDELFLGLAQTYLDEDISYFFQKHVIAGEDMDLPKEKWAEGFRFEMRDSIPQLLSDRSDVEKYLLK